MDAKSPNRKKLDELLASITENAIDSNRNVTRGLVDFANENFVHIVDLADSYDERDAEK